MRCSLLFHTQGDFPGASHVGPPLLSPSRPLNGLSHANCHRYQTKFAGAESSGTQWTGRIQRSTVNLTSDYIFFKGRGAAIKFLSAAKEIKDLKAREEFLGKCSGGLTKLDMFPFRGRSTFTSAPICVLRFSWGLAKHVQSSKVRRSVGR